MEWWAILLVMFAGLLVILFTGLPVSFGFMLFTLVGGYILWGGEKGVYTIIISYVTSITQFTFLPILLFVLMGEVLFNTGIAPLLADASDKWLGRVPGRLSLLAVIAGVLFGTFTGSGMASTAMLGKTLVPEMEKRGYKKAMSLGPILGSGGLALLIPPSSMAVVIGVIGQISIAGILIGSIIPALLLTLVMAIYIIARCFLQPELAPAYNVGNISLSEKISSFVRYVLPLSFIVFMVTGVILLGIATPTEAAATGAASCFILAVCYKKLSWAMIKKSFVGTASFSVMVYFIVMTASAFSQLLATTGASAGMVAFAVGLHISPIGIVVGMIVISLILGLFIGPTAICMITLPLFMPVVKALGADPVWFGTIFLLSMEIGGISPPFGMSLFVMKAVAPPDTTMSDVYWAAVPFCLCDLVVVAMMFVFPALVLWLPGAMH